MLTGHSRTMLLLTQATKVSTAAVLFNLLPRLLNSGTRGAKPRSIVQPLGQPSDLLTIYYPSIPRNAVLTLIDEATKSNILNSCVSCRGECKRTDKTKLHWRLCKRAFDFSSWPRRPVMDQSIPDALTKYRESSCRTAGETLAKPGNRLLLCR
jgi:hypothetical protein